MTLLTDEYGNAYSIASAVGATPVVPSDTVNLTKPTKGLYVGGAGNVHVLMANGDDVTFTGLSVGIVHPISVKRVLATGTTGTTIVAVY